MDNSPYAAWPLYLKAKDIVDITQLSRAKVYNMMNEEGFPLVRIGSNIRAPRDEFFAWFRQHYMNKPA